MGHLLDDPTFEHAAYNAYYYQLFIKCSAKPVARWIQNNPHPSLENDQDLIFKNENIAL